MYSGRRGPEEQDYVEMDERTSGSFNGDHPNNKSGFSDNLDRVLYNDLVEIVPLVQSLIDRNATSSFTRRGSMIYTKTPSRDSKKNSRNGVKSKHADKVQDKYSKNDTDGSPDDQSVSSATMAAEKEELNSLREQVEDLRRQLAEKDELLKAAEKSKNQINLIQSQVNELKQFASEKDSLVKSSLSQLNDAKIKLADKQAAVEKLQWEAKTSNQKAERLQEELDALQLQISSLMHIFEGLSKDDAFTPSEDYDTSPYYVDHLPDIDNVDETDLQKMEEAREAYVAAVAMAKERQDEESLLAAARARQACGDHIFIMQGSSFMETHLTSSGFAVTITK